MLLQSFPVKVSGQELHLEIQSDRYASQGSLPLPSRPPLLMPTLTQTIPTPADAEADADADAAADVDAAAAIALVTSFSGFHAQV